MTLTGPLVLDESEDWRERHRRELARLGASESARLDPRRRTEQELPLWLQTIGAAAAHMAARMPGVNLGLAGAEPIEAGFSGLIGQTMRATPEGETQYQKRLAEERAKRTPLHDVAAGRVVGDIRPPRPGESTAGEALGASAQLRRDVGEATRQIREDQSQPLWARGLALGIGAGELTQDLYPGKAPAIAGARWLARPEPFLRPARVAGGAVDEIRQVSRLEDQLAASRAMERPDIVAPGVERAPVIDPSAVVQTTGRPIAGELTAATRTVATRPGIQRMTGRTQEQLERFGLPEMSGASGEIPPPTKPTKAQRDPHSPKATADMSLVARDHPVRGLLLEDGSNAARAREQLVREARDAQIRGDERRAGELGAWIAHLDLAITRRRPATIADIEPGEPYTVSQLRLPEADALAESRGTYKGKYKVTFDDPKVDAPLTPEQLADKYAADGMKHAEMLAYKHTKGFHPDQRERHLEDFRSEALVAFVSATKSWKADRGAPFMSYAFRRMEGSIIDFQRAEDPYGRGWRTKAKQTGEELPLPFSIEQQHEAGIDPRAADVVLPAPAEERARAPLMEQLQAELAKLPERDREVIRRRFEQDMSLKEVGAGTGLSESGALRRIRAIAARLRTQELTDLAAREGHLRGGAPGVPRPSVQPAPGAPAALGLPPRGAPARAGEGAAAPGDRGGVRPGAAPGAPLRAQGQLAAEVPAPDFTPGQLDPTRHALRIDGSFFSSKSARSLAVAAYSGAQTGRTVEVIDKADNVLGVFVYHRRARDTGKRAYGKVRFVPTMSGGSGGAGADVGRPVLLNGQNASALLSKASRGELITVAQAKDLLLWLDSKPRGTFPIDQEDRVRAILEATVAAENENVLRDAAYKDARKAMGELAEQQRSADKLRARLSEIQRGHERAQTTITEGAAAGEQAMDEGAQARASKLSAQLEERREKILADLAAAVERAHDVEPKRVELKERFEPIRGKVIAPKVKGGTETARTVVRAERRGIDRVRAIVDRRIKELVSHLTKEAEGKEAPLRRVVAALRLEAKRLMSTEELVKRFGKSRGLLWSRELTIRPGRVAGEDFFQTAAQRKYGSEFAQGRNTAGPAGARRQYEDSEVRPLLKTADALEQRIKRAEDLQTDIYLAELDPREQIAALGRGKDALFGKEELRGLLTTYDRHPEAAIARANEWIDFHNKPEVPETAIELEPLPEQAPEDLGPSMFGGDIAGPEIPFGNEDLPVAKPARAADGQIPRIVWPDEARAEALRKERERELDRIERLLRDAGRMGVSRAELEPTVALVRKTIAEIKGIRTAIGELGVPDLPEIPEGSPHAKARGIMRQVDHMFSPETSDLIRGVVEGNPQEFEARSRTLSNAEVLNDLAPRLGMDPRKLGELQLKRGRASSVYVAGKMALDHQAGLVQAAAAEYGTASDVYAREYARFQQLVFDLSEGSSEAGRLLGIHKLYAQRRYAEGVAAAWELAEKKAEAARIRTAHTAAAKAVAMAEAKHQEALAELAKATDEARRAYWTEISARRAAVWQRAQERMAELEQRLAQADQIVGAAQVRASTASEFARQKLIAKAVKEGTRPEHVEALALFDPDDLAGMQEYLSKTAPMSKGQILWHAFIGNILAGTRTLLTNLSTSQLFLLHERYLKLLQAGVTEPLFAKMAGRDREAFLAAQKPAFMAMARGYPEGLIKTLYVLGKGNAPWASTPDIKRTIAGRGPTLLPKADLEIGPFRFHFGGVKLGDVFSVGSRGSLGVDMLVRIPGSEAAKVEIAFREAARELRRDLGREPTDPELAARAEDLLHDVQFAGKHRREIDQRGRRPAFSDEPHGFTRQIVAPAAHYGFPIPLLGRTPLIGFLLPFPNIGDRLISRAIRFIPGEGIVEGAVRARLGQKEEASEAAAEGLAVLSYVAAAAATAIWWMADTEEVIGASPTSESKRREFEARGRIPFSVVRRDGSVIEWGRWEPFVNPIKWLLAYKQSVEEGTEKDPIGRAQKIVGDIADSFLQASYMKGLGDTLYVIRNPDSPRAERLANEIIAATVVPASGLSGAVARESDVYRRDVGDLGEAIKAKVPGLSQTLAPERGGLGEPLPQAGGNLTPVRTGRDRPDPVYDELEAVRAKVTELDYIGLVRAKIRDVELDHAQLNRYQQLAGEFTREELTQLFSTQRYRAMEPEKKAREIRSQISIARAKARQAYANELMGFRPDGGVLETSPAERATAVVIGLAGAESNAERAKLLSRWQGRLEREPALQQELVRRLPTDGPSYQDYLRAAPLVEQLEAMPEFADALGNQQGTPAIWSQYHAERKEYDRLRRERKVLEAAAYLVAHPVLQRYRALAARELGKNPQATRLRRANPILRRFPLPRDDQD